jgi:hypothetical protein
MPVCEVRMCGTHCHSISAHSPTVQVSTAGVRGAKKVASALESRAVDMQLVMDPALTDADMQVGTLLLFCSFFHKQTGV